MAATHNNYGANYTLVYQPLDGKPSMPPASKVGGRLRIWHDSYTSTAIDSGSTVFVAKMPKMAVLYDAFITAEALGGSATLALGTDAFTVSGTTTAEDPDRFITATVMNGAGKTIAMLPRPTGTANAASTNASGTAHLGVGYEFLTETNIIIRVGGATLAADKVIKVGLIYSID